MRRILNFPTKYEVHKPLTNEKFLAMAKPTEAAAQLLHAYLRQVEILYAIPYPDDDVIVLCVEINLEGHRKHAFEELAEVIATAIPHPCLLVMKFEHYFRLILFEKRDLVAGKIGSTVKDVYGTYNIDIANVNSAARELLTHLGGCIETAKTAKDLYTAWKDLLLSGEGGGRASLDDLRDSVYIPPARGSGKKQAQNRAIDKMRQLSQEDYTAENFKRDHEILPEEMRYNEFEQESPDKDDPDMQMLLQFLCTNARRLYRESPELQTVGEEAWLRMYLRGCKEYADTYAMVRLSDDALMYIKEAFWADEPFEDEDLDDYFDIESFKECIGVDSLYDEDE